MLCCSCSVMYNAKLMFPIPLSGCSAKRNLVCNLIFYCLFSASKNMVKKNDQNYHVIMLEEERVERQKIKSEYFLSHNTHLAK